MKLRLMLDVGLRARAVGAVWPPLCQVVAAGKPVEPATMVWETNHHQYHLQTPKMQAKGGYMIRWGRV